MKESTDINVADTWSNWKVLCAVTRLLKQQETKHYFTGYSTDNNYDPVTFIRYDIISSVVTAP